METNVTEHVGRPRVRRSTARPRVECPPQRSPRNGIPFYEAPGQQGGGRSLINAVVADYGATLDSVYEMADQVSTSNAVASLAAVKQVCMANGWTVLPEHQQLFARLLDLPDGCRLDGPEAQEVVAAVGRSARKATRAARAARPVRSAPRIRKLLAEAHALAYREIEQRARRVMERHPHISAFCMAMGSATFYDRDNEPIMDENRSYLKSFYRFLDEFDGALKLTGSPLMLRSHGGPVITDW